MSTFDVIIMWISSILISISLLPLLARRNSSTKKTQPVLFCRNLYMQNISQMFYTMTNSYSQTDAGHVFSKINETCQQMGNGKEGGQILTSGTLPCWDWESSRGSAAVRGWVRFCGADCSTAQLGNSQWLGIWVLKCCLCSPDGHGQQKGYMGKQGIQRGRKELENS